MNENNPLIPSAISAIDETSPMEVESPIQPSPTSSSPLAASSSSNLGPAAAAKHRHASTSQPIYNDQALSRIPDHVAQRRYSLPPRHD